MLIQTRCMLGCLSGVSGMFLNAWFQWAALQPDSGSVSSLSCFQRRSPLWVRSGSNFICCFIPSLCLPAQVSNWFANARRRLKNTVRQPDLSWALRIKLYNKYVQGNAERLSISSDDSCSEGEAWAVAPVSLFRFQGSCTLEDSPTAKITAGLLKVTPDLHRLLNHGPEKVALQH